MSNDTFPLILAAAANAKRADRIIATVHALREAQEAGFIANARFVEMKDVVSYAVEKGWDNIYFNHGLGAWGEQPTHIGEWLSKHPYPASGVARFGSALRKWLKARPADAATFADRVAAFAAEVEVLGALLDEMKGKAVKNAPGMSAEERERERFKAPAATTEATRRVRDMLTASVEVQFENLIAAFIRRYEGEIAHFQKVRDKRVAEIAASDKPSRVYRLYSYSQETSGANISFLSKIVTDDDRAIRADAAEIVATQARKDAEEVRALFVAKNLRKIVSIVEAKEKETSLTNCAPVAHTVSLGGYEGTFVIAFADGSGFTFRNSVIFKISTRGTPFNQFPLTFHDVKLAGGEKMARPSEERMNTVFVKVEKEGA